MTLRVGLGLALVLGVLYVASPWLLPAETIRRHVEASLAQRLGTSVSLGAMRIGWGEGVVIDGLAIQNPPGFSDGPMVQIGRIRCDFSPLQLLLRQRIAWMDVEKLTVRAEDDPAGRLNVECLSRLPTNVDTHRLRVRQSEFSVFLHDQPRPLTANVSDLQIHRLRSGPGHVTMTGSFQQSGSPAPITLRMSVGGQEEHAVLVDCRFSNLDLAQLPRSRSVWGDLPIESLRGRCGGQLVFELGRNLRVEELRLELLAENLVVKPRGVEALPKIDRAGLQLDAELDALSERADVRRFHLRLPGLQLDGSGVLYADLLRGDWEALDSLRLHGTVHPERLLALLTGRETLLDDLSVRGAVQFAAVAQQQRDVLGVDLSLDAGAACIRTKGRVLKPADRPLRLQWQGGAQRADDACRINVDHARLVVGENSITAAGHIEDIRAFRPPETAQRDSPAVLSALLKALRGVRLNGALELKEPQALISPVLRTPETLEISGAWSGPWSFLPGENPKFTLGLRGGPEAVLRIADAFAKPAGRELSLELSGVIDPDTRSIAHVLLDVLSGQGRVSLEETTIRLPEKDQPLRAEGELEAERIEAFGDWASGDWRKHPPISGDVKGAFGGVWEASAGKAEVHVEADLAALAVSAGEVFTKPAGQRADLNIHARHRFRENAGAATLAVDLEGGTFQVDSEYDKGVVSASVLADIQYLSWLHASSPLLHRALDGGRLAGTLRAEGSARWDGRSLLYTAKANSEKLDCRIGEKSPLVNLRGKRVALAIQGSMKDESPEIRLWNVEKTSLAVDESSIAICDLKTRWRREEPRAAGGKTRPWDACRELSARVQIVGDAGDLLGEVFPKWASWAGQHKLVGKIHTDGTLQMDRKSLSAALRVDAGDLGVQNVEGFAKPQGQPAVAHLDVTTPRDFSAPQLRRLAIKTHAVQLDAQVRGKARLSDAGLPIGIEPTEAQIRAELKNAAELASFWPAMKEHNLTGRAKVALDWTAGPDKLGTISEFTLKADDLRGTYRGKSCRLDGDVYVKALRLADDKTLHVERAVTENLEFAAGDNHGWLLADVQLAPGAPKGTFHLLLESLDEKDLADWLAEPEAASAPASAPADRTDADLALQRRSEQLLGRLREWFHDADLTGRVSAARWRTYDANVKQSYPTRELEASLRVKDNTVHAHYDASLYGGRVSGRMDTNLTVPKPVVTGHAEQVDVKATKTIQPQISRQFPGNTVSGRISQTKDVHFPLRDLLCSVLDNQYRLCPEGTGRLIATDGLLVGKAAPDFVTKIFPGLNLTKYPYRTMTTFMKLLPDGTAENETFLFGAYDLYMEGVTKRDYTIQYTIGLVLMGGAFPPEALRDWKQGRIPILKMKGRIEDGTLMDDEVSYPLPNETLFEIFLKNNLVYRAWVNLQAASAGK